MDDDSATNIVASLVMEMTCWNEIQNIKFYTQKIRYTVEEVKHFYGWVTSMHGKGICYIKSIVGDRNERSGEKKKTVLIMKSWVWDAKRKKKLNVWVCRMWTDIYHKLFLNKSTKENRQGAN